MLFWSLKTSDNEQIEHTYISVWAQLDLNIERKNSFHIIDHCVLDFMYIISFGSHKSYEIAIILALHK